MEPRKEEKTCTRCHQTKPLSEFPIEKRNKVPVHAQCKVCVVIRSNAWYHRRRAEQGFRRADKARRLTPDEWAAIRESGQLQCYRCKATRPIDQFGTSKRGEQIYTRRICKACERDRNKAYQAQHPDRHYDRVRKYRCDVYGITLDDFRQMVQKQNGLCALCGRPLEERFRTIDHDHATGNVRGIVHRQCNLIIGNANEDIFVLARAIGYVLKHARASPRKTPEQALFSMVNRVEITP